MGTPTYPPYNILLLITLPFITFIYHYATLYYAYLLLRYLPFNTLHYPLYLIPYHVTLYYAYLSITSPFITLICLLRYPLLTFTTLYYVYSLITNNNLSFVHDRDPPNSYHVARDRHQ